MLGSLGRAARRLLRLLARPVGAAQGRSGVALLPYRGYGSHEEIFLIGRVFRQSEKAQSDRRQGTPGAIRNVLRRITRGALAGAAVTARFCGTEKRVVTDEDGYFRIHMKLQEPPPDDRSWHEVTLSMDEPRLQARGSVFIPPRSCRFVVISDIDDTVVQTGIANKLVMMWRLFVEDAQSRLAFPGVATLYRALHGGVSGSDGNPMLYVSRAPWGTYEVLEEFFQIHGIPVGPVLFLREWGVTWTSPLPREARQHKEELISHMLALYKDLPFVLIGDSGQRDPEIYCRIVSQNPGRILAVFIRNVSRGPARTADIERLAVTLSGAASSLVLAADSVAMAEQAARLGLVPDGTPEAVREDRAGEADASEPQPGATERLSRSSRQGTARAVRDGGLKAMIDGEPTQPPPNVVVEPEGGRKDGPASSNGTARKRTRGGQGRHR